MHGQGRDGNFETAFDRYRRQLDSFGLQMNPLRDKLMEADLDAADGNNFFSQRDIGFRQTVVARRVDPVEQMDDQTFSLGIFLPEHCALASQSRFRQRQPLNSADQSRFVNVCRRFTASPAAVYRGLVSLAAGIPLHHPDASRVAAMENLVNSEIMSPVLHPVANCRRGHAMIITSALGELLSPRVEEFLIDEFFVFQQHSQLPPPGRIRLGQLDSVESASACRQKTESVTVRRMSRRCC